MTLNLLLTSPNSNDDLGDGLVSRWSTAADAANIGQLIGSVFRDSPDGPFNERAADVARIVLCETLPFPFMTPGDFAIVEDTSKPERPVVACTCFWRHEWSYGGVKFGVGQPEIVATDPAYRNRGLVRVLLEMAHARSAAEGHLVQAITGIPYFYRQFGYEYVLDLGGSRVMPVTKVPDQAEEEPEPYHLRPATLTDVPHMLALYNQRRSTSLVWHETDETYWRHLVESWDDPVVVERGPALTGHNGRMFMIVDGRGTVCGCVWLAGKRWHHDLVIYQLELLPQVNWQAIMPGLLRTLRRYGESIPATQLNQEPLRELRFSLGRAHPVYDLLSEQLLPNDEPLYAWYLRVPDVPAFIHRIAPVLEKRLARSVLTGLTGVLKFDFYRGGLQLHFERGKLITAEPWRALHEDDADAGCPPLIFLQLLFGYRSLAELRAIFPDVWAKREARLFINTLFPKQPSTVFSLDNT
jgi:GNAT superfamily N-acetyltransferase